MKATTTTSTYDLAGWHFNKDLGSWMPNRVETPQPKPTHDGWRYNPTMGRWFTTK